MLVYGLVYSLDNRQTDGVVHSGKMGHFSYCHFPDVKSFRAKNRHTFCQNHKKFKEPDYVLISVFKNVSCFFFN